MKAHILFNLRVRGCYYSLISPTLCPGRDTIMLVYTFVSVRPYIVFQMLIPRQNGENHFPEIL